jgi:hypothetical protein
MSSLTSDSRPKCLLIKPRGQGPIQYVLRSPCLIEALDAGTVDVVFVYERSYARAAEEG